MSDMSDVVSLHLRIGKIGESWSLSMYNGGLNVSVGALRQLGLDFCALANTGMRLGDPIITRRYLGGPIVKVEFELMERANVARVSL